MSDMTVLEQAKLMTPPKVENYRYQLVMRVPFDALDNIQARQIAQGYLKIASLPNEASVKLQRLEGNKPPSWIPL
jgi:hypothetical protein